MNRTTTCALALTGAVLVASTACSSSSSSSSTSSSSVSSSSAAGGHTDSSLARILTASGALPAASVAPAASMAGERSQQASQMQTVQQASFSPAACGQDFLAYMDAIGGAPARAKGSSASPKVMVVLAAQPDAAAAQQVIARFTSLTGSCATMTMSYQGQSQAVRFTKDAPKGMDGADEVALGSLSQGSGEAVQRRRVELARVGTVIIQVTTQPDGQAAAQKVMAAVVKAVAANPAR